MRAAARTLLFLLLSAASLRAERLPLKAYTVADGLAHNAVNKIVRDRRGFLWFCTAEGLSLFDGYRFTNYGVREGLPSARVADILQTREGDYWVATHGGLYKFDPKGVPDGDAAAGGEARVRIDQRPMFTSLPVPPADGLATRVTTLLQARDGTIWFGTDRGLYRVAHQTASVASLSVDIGVPTTEQRMINSLVEDRHSTLWIGTNKGLHRRWPDGRTARYGTSDGLPDDYVHDVVEAPHGQLWVATRFGGLVRLTTDTGARPPVVLRAYNSSNGFIANWIFDLHQAGDGRLWVATNNGIAVFDPDDQQPPRPPRVHTKRNGFLFHEITTLSEDGDNNLWLGTSEGAMKLARNGFVTFGEEEGIGRAFPAFETDSGDTYFYGYILGDDRGTVFEREGAEPFSSRPVAYWFNLGRFDGERFTWVEPDATRGIILTWDDKPFVARTREDEWWIGRYVFRGVRQFTDLKRARPFIEYTTNDGLHSPIVEALFEDSRGHLWVSTVSEWGNGLALREPTTRRLRDMARADGLMPLAGRLATAFEEDRAGGVWIGFDQGGLARYAAGRFTTFTTDQGVPAGAITDLHVDREGRLWIATSRGGLARLDNPLATHPVFVIYTVANGLSGNRVTAVTADLYGDVYAATARGLDRLTPATGRVKRFTTADGLAPGEIRAAFTERSGALWFGTRAGLSRFVPEPTRESPPPPVIFITGLSIAGARQPVSALGETAITLADLAHDKNDMQLDFVGLSFAPGDTLHYQYKLEGGHANWSAPTDQRTVHFAGLSPGQYTFLIQAINSDGIVSATPASVTFSILPPIWQRWWFVTLLCLGAMLVFYSIYRYRISRLLELERVRTRIASDLHDEIGSNLSLIAMASDIAGRTAKEADTQVAGWLSLIANTSRESVDSMSDIVWAVNPSKDRIGDLAHRMRRVADEAFTAANIECRFDATGAENGLKIGVDTRREIFMIFKEAVNNIARHAHCTKAEIGLTIEAKTLQLRMRDNGRGFDVSTASNGNGLASMRRRADRLRGTLAVQSQPGTGTTIVLTAPLAAASPRTHPRVNAQ